MVQARLNDADSIPILRTVLIRTQQDFDKLFDRFVVLRGVSFVSSVELLLEFLEDAGFGRSS